MIGFCSGKNIQMLQYIARSPTRRTAWSVANGQLDLAIGGEVPSEPKTPWKLFPMLKMSWCWFYQSFIPAKRDTIQKKTSTSWSLLPSTAIHYS